MKKILSVLPVIAAFSLTMLAQNPDSVMLLQGQSTPVRTPEDSLIQQVQKLRQLINPTDSAQQAVMEQYDILITRNWGVKVVRVKDITPEGIEFLYPFNTEIQTVQRDKTSQILYAGGKREVFYPLEKPGRSDSLDSGRLVFRSNKAWEDIILVESESDIPDNLTLIKVLDTRYDGDRINTPNQMLEKSGIIVLKKRTANLGGTHMVISDKRFTRPYGDYPYVLMEAKAYGFGVQEAE